ALRLHRSGRRFDPVTAHHSMGAPARPSNGAEGRARQGLKRPEAQDDKLACATANKKSARLSAGALFLLQPDLLRPEHHQSLLADFGVIDDAVLAGPDTFAVRGAALFGILVRIILQIRHHHALVGIADAHAAAEAGVPAITLMLVTFGVGDIEVVLAVN